MKGPTLEQFLVEGRAAQVYPEDLPRILRDYWSDGPLKAVVNALLTAQAEYVKAAMGQNLVSEESVRTAIGLRGQVVGFETALQVLHSLMVETEDDDAGQSTDDYDGQRRSGF